MQVQHKEATRFKSAAAAAAAGAGAGLNEADRAYRKMVQDEVLTQPYYMHKQTRITSTTDLRLQVQGC